MTFEIKLSFTDREIADLLCSALESGYAPWVVEKNSHFSDGPRAQPWGEGFTPDYIAAPLTEGGRLELKIVAESGRNTKRTITRKQLQEGLQLMAEKVPFQFGQFIADNADGITGSVFLQFCCFGRVVYD